MVIFVKNGESMSVDEPQRSVNWKIESRTGEKMRLCDPLTRIARHTADISRWIEHTSRFAVGRSPIDNLLDFIGSCIAINQNHLNPFPTPSFYLSWSLPCSFSFRDVLWNQRCNKIRFLRKRLCHFYKYETAKRCSVVKSTTYELSRRFHIFSLYLFQDEFLFDI